MSQTPNKKEIEEGPYFKPGGTLVGVKWSMLTQEQLDKTLNALSWLSQIFGTNLRDSNSFFSDNIFTFSKMLGFLYEPDFVEAAENALGDDEHARSIIWRTHVLCWAAQHVLPLPGDFVELGCFKGTTAHAIADYINITEQDKTYYLYDTFKLIPTGRPDDYDLESEVRERFKDYHNIRIISGRVPESLDKEAPDKIALMHVDLNYVEAEMGALEKLFDRVTSGGIIILDDYGWVRYKDQHVAEKAFFEERGYKVLELPTGQGFVLKR